MLNRTVVLGGTLAKLMVSLPLQLGEDVLIDTLDELIVGKSRHLGWVVLIKSGVVVIGLVVLHLQLLESVGLLLRWDDMLRHRSAILQSVGVLLLLSCVSLVGMSSLSAEVGLHL